MQQSLMRQLIPIDPIPDGAIPVFYTYPEKDKPVLDTLKGLLDLLSKPCEF